MGDETSELVVNLLDVVYERLFDLMDKFYVQVSNYACTEEFKEI